jgi:hypothetical protein
MNFLKIPRLNKVFGEFGHAFQQLRAQAPYTCQKQLMEQDPLLRKLVSQSAVEFVREQEIEAIAEQFLGAIAGAVFLCDWREMSAFHFCIGISCTGNGACNGDCHVFHITGNRKPLYRPKRSLLMGASEEIKLLNRVGRFKRSSIIAMLDRHPEPVRIQPALSRG